MCVAISKVASEAAVAGNLCEPEVGYMSSKHATAHDFILVLLYFPS